MEEEKPTISSIKDIFERIKTLHGFKSDRECWEAIELSPGFYKDVKAERKHVSNEAALRIASKAGLPADGVLLFIQRQKARNDDEKAVWDDILQERSHNV